MGNKIKYGLFVLILALSLALFLAGCSNEKEASQIVAPSGDTGVQQEPTTGTSTATGTMQVLTLSDAEKKLSEDRLKTGEKVAVSTPLKMMNIGDVYTFAVGIKNIYPNPKNFRLNPKFDNAKTSGLANLIHTDSAIDSWLGRNRFESFTLASGEQKIVPLIVEVGPEIAADSETIPGSYTFEVIFEIESSPRFWDKYNTGEDPLVIKIK